MSGFEERSKQQGIFKFGASPPPASGNPEQHATASSTPIPKGSVTSKSKQNMTPRKQDKKNSEGEEEEEEVNTVDELINVT